MLGVHRMFTLLLEYGSININAVRIDETSTCTNVDGNFEVHQGEKGLGGTLRHRLNTGPRKSLHRQAVGGLCYQFFITPSCVL